MRSPIAWMRRRSASPRCADQAELVGRRDLLLVQLALDGVDDVRGQLDAPYDDVVIVEEPRFGAVLQQLHQAIVEILVVDRVELVRIVARDQQADRARRNRFDELLGIVGTELDQDVADLRPPQLEDDRRLDLDRHALLAEGVDVERQGLPARIEDVHAVPRQLEGEPLGMDVVRHGAEEQAVEHADMTRRNAHQDGVPQQQKGQPDGQQDADHDRQGAVALCGAAKVAWIDAHRLVPPGSKRPSCMTITRSPMSK